MSHLFSRLGAASCFLGVCFGAFGAHGLKDGLAPELFSAYETGVLYHLFHSLGLFAIAMLHDRNPTKGLVIGGWCMVMGIVLFSGSLYTMALTGYKTLGWVTPVGGTTWLVGWASSLWGIQRPPHGEDS